MSDRSSSGKPHVLIAGGGIAGLEALMALRDLAEDRVDISLAAPTPEFTYKPLLVEEPFSSQPAERHELAPLVEGLDASFIQQAIARVAPDAHEVELGDGAALAYDVAVICVGGTFRPALRGGRTFLPANPLPFEELLPEPDAAEGARVGFIVPPGVTWPLPIYELAMMAQRRLAERGLRDMRCVIVTPESAPLIMFGAIASQAVARLLEGRGIEVRGGIRVSETEDGELVGVPGHQSFDFSSFISLPVLEGPHVEGLPADDRGFIPIDEHARVVGADDVYASGDGTTFPIKQGGIGTQQADAAAEHIAARFGAPLEPQPFHPVLRGKLLTGDESVDLRADVAGGAGEGMASDDYLWWPPHKVAGRYLASFLAGEASRLEDQPPRHPMDVEVALPKEWHEDPMALDPYGPLGVD